MGIGSDSSDVGSNSGLKYWRLCAASESRELVLSARLRFLLISSKSNASREDERIVATEQGGRCQHYGILSGVSDQIGTLAMIGGSSRIPRGNQELTSSVRHLPW